MNLYRVIFDGEPNYVEARTFAEAIVLWRANLIEENEPGDIAPDEDPESVELVHEKSVVRDILEIEKRANKMLELFLAMQDEAGPAAASAHCHEFAIKARLLPPDCSLAPWEPSP